MRSFVFLLILANLMFFAWTQGVLGVPSSSEAFRMQQQLLAEQVTVVARDVPPPETTPPVAVANVEACVLVGELSTASADQLSSRLAERFPAFKQNRSELAANFSYWVNIPPLANKKESDTKAAELKKLGITDFFVVQESGANNRAISLGLYSSKDTANAYLETLRRKGVKSAKVTERTVRPASVSLEIWAPEAQLETLRQVLAEVLPEAKPGNCKPPADAAQ